MASPQSRKTFRARLDHMITVLRGEIMTGKRQPGDFLPSERELSTLFHLSNKLVRSGLEQLVTEGLIVKIPRVGNQVSETARNGKVTIRFGYHRSLEQEADLIGLLEQFMKAHPSIYVHPIPIDFQNYTDMVREYLDSGMLDAVTVNIQNFDQLKIGRNHELLQPQRPNPDIYPVLEQAFAEQERIYVRPLLFSPLVLCYNPNHFREKKIPLPFQPCGWDELLHCASQLSIENERFGFYSFLLSNNRWPIFLLQNGASSVERMVEGITFWRDILYNHQVFPTYLSGNGADAEELFADGKVSIIMTSYLALNALKASKIPFDVAPLPAFGGRETLLMAIGVGISRKSQALPAAQALADFLSSEHAQLHIRKTTLSIPALAGAAEWAGQEEMYRPPHYQIFRELLPYCRLYTDIGLNAEEMNLVLKEARLFWSRLQTKDTMRKRIAEILTGKTPQTQ